MNSPKRPVVTRCNACGGALVSGLSGVRDPQSLEAFDIVRCAACGLGHTAPVPADLGAYYGLAYYGNRHSFTDRYCWARRVRILSAAAPRAGTLLDVGCGDGSFLARAARRGWTGFGTEVGAASEASRGKGIDVRADVDDFADQAPFDAATMWHTLEHFPDPARVLSQVRGSLKSTGVLVAAVPDAAGLQASMFGRFWFHLDVPRHLFHFDRQALERLLDRSGFRVDRWHHQELEIDLFGWIQSALNAVLPMPNVLFQSLTGKPRKSGPTELALSYALGTAVAPAALAATALGTWTGRGGTLVAIARPV